jgi:hypothetical protein
MAALGSKITRAKQLSIGPNSKILQILYAVRWLRY